MIGAKVPLFKGDNGGFLRGGESPPTPLEKGGRRGGARLEEDTISKKVPLFKGDLGGSSHSKSPFLRGI